MIVATRGSADYGELVEEAYNTSLQSLKRFIPETVVDQIASTNFTKDKVMELNAHSKAGNFTEIEMRLSDFQKKYFRKLVELFNNQNTSYKSIASGIVSLEEEIKRAGNSVEEIEAMLQITSIARYSTDYWCNNEFKWKLAINSKIIRTTNYPITRYDGGDFPKYLPFANDVTMFIMILEDGTAYLLKCPGGLVWDQETCTCVLPKPGSGDGDGGGGGGVDWDVILKDIGGAVTGMSAGGWGGIIGAAISSGLGLL